MNSFNRLLLLYIVLFNRKILYDYNRKNAKILCFQKNDYICNVIKKQRLMKIDYRISVIFDDEVIRVKFATEEAAKSAVQDLKKLYPDKFMCGAVEKRREYWEVVWVLNSDRLS